MEVVVVIPCGGECAEFPDRWMTEGVGDRKASAEVQVLAGPRKERTKAGMMRAKLSPMEEGEDDPTATGVADEGGLV